MGQRFEQTEVQGLTREQCALQRSVMVGDRGSRHQCVSANGIARPVSPEIERAPTRDCAAHHYFRGSCVWPLPSGHKRVELVPHNCGYGHCTPIDNGPGNTVMPVWR